MFWNAEKYSIVIFKQNPRMYSISAFICEQPLLLHYNNLGTLSKYQLFMKVDTGAAVNIISKSTFERICKGENLEYVTVSLNTVSDQKLSVLGKTLIKTEIGKGTYNLWLYVVDSFIHC